MERKRAWTGYDEAEQTAVQDFAEGYKGFISECKTERECTARAVELARKAGYTPLDEAIKAQKPLAAGDKVYAVNRGKSIVLVHIGKEPLDQGMNILGAHVDSPRLDVKQNPLYEEGDLAYLDTHYYGGVKKYQWVTTPLALHGVVIKKDSSRIDINLGEKADDPVFVVTDLLIHLASEQMQKKAAEVIDGETLDLLVGGHPLVVDKDDTSDLAKMAEKKPVVAKLLSILADTYDLEEEDFLSAELEIVPAGPARDLGFDRSMILGYGQDDRSCSYPSLIAMLDSQDLTRTGACILVDKEEIGSVGATGMTSLFFENMVAEILRLTGNTDPLSPRRCLARSNMLSSDVSAGFDPLYASAFETKNVAYMGRGVVFNKFTGSRGKSGSNDADAEYMAKIRHVMELGDVAYQTSELGRVDVGGGGTIAYILAKYGMNVIDCGIPVLSMHAPWEVTDKADLHEAYKAYVSFLKNA